jgi:hypothetical protein
VDDASSAFVQGTLVLPPALRSRVLLLKSRASSDGLSPPVSAGLLAQTEAKREQRKKERLQDYYRRNFGDYFSFEVGNNKSAISEETRRKIEKWLEDNADGAPPAAEP